MRINQTLIDEAASSNTFHDRYILTNNALIKVGGGFNLLDDKTGKATKQTAVDILHPGIQSSNNSCDSEYISIINRTINKVVNCTTQGRWKHYPEHEKCKNRLITEEV